MAYLSPAQRTYLEAQITLKQAQLDKANATYEAMLENPLEDWRLDSNEGSQRSKRYKLTEYKDQIDSLQAEIDQLWRKLRGGGLVSMNLRRY